MRVKCKEKINTDTVCLNFDLHYIGITILLHIYSFLFDDVRPFLQS